MRPEHDRSVYTKFPNTFKHRTGKKVGILRQLKANLLEAVQFLFQYDVNPTENLDVALEQFWEAQRRAALLEAQKDSGKLWEDLSELPPPNTAEASVRLFADPLIRGVIQHRTEIDALISNHAKNWDLHRMAVVVPAVTPEHQGLVVHQDHRGLRLPLDEGRRVDGRGLGRPDVVDLLLDVEGHRPLLADPWRHRKDDADVLVLHGLGDRIAGNPARRWKLSEMDIQSREKWVEFSKAKDEMFFHTDIEQSPWYTVEADDKRRARLNCIAHILSMVPYEDATPPPLELPPRRPPDESYVRPPKSDQNFVPDVEL